MDDLDLEFDIDTVSEEKEAADGDREERQEPLFGDQDADVPDQAADVVQATADEEPAATDQADSQASDDMEAPESGTPAEDVSLA